MIERYSDIGIDAIWSDEYRYSLWEQIELAYLKFMDIDFNEPESPTPVEVKDKEKETKHELVAFLKVLHSNLEKANPNNDAIRFLHYGLTSSDIIDTASVIQFKSSFQVLNADLNLLLNKIDRLIEKTKNIKAIGRTHGKHAEPIDLSNRFVNLKKELIYCLSEIEESIYDLPGKLSGPVGTSSLLDENAAERTLASFDLRSSEYKLQIIPRHLFVKPIASIVLLMSTYEKFCTYIRLSALDEIDEIQEGFSENQCGSSAMPHKNNPILSENICGLARLSKSYLDTTYNNIPLWFERDISHSSTERIIWPDIFHLSVTATKRFTSLLKNLAIKTENINRNLDNSTVKNSHLELLVATADSNRFDAYSDVQKKYL